MISSVSTVNFKANPVQSAQERINAPGKFTKPDSAPLKPENEPKKKHGFLKALAGLVVAAAVVGGGLVIGVRTKALKALSQAELKDAKLLKKSVHYLAKAGEWIDTNVCKRVMNWIAKEPKTPKTP